MVGEVSWSLPLLFAAGLVAGTLNVVAGGGSFLTLPLMIFLGIPAGVANGTNRVALLFQNAGAVWGFRRHGVLDVQLAVRLAAPAIVGAALGSWMALQVSDFAFRRLLAIRMLLMALWTVVTILVFASAGAINWGAGMVLGAGNVIGGQLGVRLTVLKGHSWIRWLVSATIVLLALRLWLVGS